MPKIVKTCQLIRKHIFLKMILCNRLQSECSRLSLKDFPKFYIMKSIAIRVQLIALKDFPKITLVQSIVIWMQSIAAGGFFLKTVSSITITEPLSKLPTSYQPQINH